MKAEIITIGDEILIGQTIDTNSAWMGENLELIGFKVNRIVTISDNREEIIDALTSSLGRADIVLMTGGLGPTQDDITKQTLAEFFESDMIQNKEVENRIVEFFKSIEREPLDVHYQQASLPEKCQVILNDLGTASGMWFEKDNKVLVSMPGVPYEMKGLMKKDVLKRLQLRFKTPEVYHKTIMTIGRGESDIAASIEGLENQIRKDGLSLAYLPSSGMVKLRISGVGEDRVALQRKIHNYEDQIKKNLGQSVYGTDSQVLASVVGELLSKRGLTIATAESCTGGMIGAQITSIPGSSEYFLGGSITYSNESKEKLLNVSSEVIKKHGAVSEIVVKEMSRGVRTLYGADIGISTSGVAGPSGGTETKPVGTVWIGISTKEKTKGYKFTFGKSRKQNISRTAQTALNILRKEIE